MSKPLSEQPNELYEAVRGLQVAQSVLEDLHETLERVRRLHKKYKGDVQAFCEHCQDSRQSSGMALYPCPTLKALDGEQS